MTDHAPRTPVSDGGQLDSLPKPSRLDVRSLEPEGVATPANNKALSAFYALLNDRGHTQSPLKETRVSFAEVRAAAAAKGKYRRADSDWGLMKMMEVRG